MIESVSLSIYAAKDGNGDLPSMPGLTAPVKADIYPEDWSSLTTAILILCVLVGCAIPFIILLNVTRTKDLVKQRWSSLNHKQKKTVE